MAARYHWPSQLWSRRGSTSASPCSYSTVPSLIATAPSSLPSSRMDDYNVEKLEDIADADADRYLLPTPASDRKLHLHKFSNWRLAAACKKGTEEEMDHRSFRREQTPPRCWSLASGSTKMP